MNGSVLQRARLLLAAGLCLGAACAARAGPALADIERELRARPEQAVQALRQIAPTLHGAERVEALVVRGHLLVQVNDPAAAEQVAQELDVLASAGAEPLAAAAAGLVRARAAARGGPALRAERLLNAAVAALPANAPGSLRLRFVMTQAGVQQSLGKLDVAVSLYQQAVALSDSHAPLWRRSDARGSLAYALLLARQPEQALAVNQEAAALARQAGDLLALSTAMTVDSIVFGALGRTADALKASHDAIDLARQAGDTRQEVLAIANLADSYLKRNDHATALRLSLQALPLAREVGDLSSESVALTNAGLATIALGRHNEGQALVAEALRLEDSIGALTDKLGILDELGHMLERVGLLRPAWAALSEHRQLADQVFQQQHQQAVLELQEGFDAERRRRDLATLRADNGLKEAQLLQRELQHTLMAVGVAAGMLLLAVVAVLLRRMRRSNAQLQSSNAQLQVASERDPLTGLANRRHLLAVMQQSASQGGGFDGSMLLIDIDHFKRINDQHGHAAGDQVLVETARRLRAALREDDLTVRWGGEEFLVVVRATPQAEVEALAERLLAAIGGAPVMLGREAIAVTASIGFATFPLQSARRPLAWERAIDLVDTAMYLAKAHGRNRAYGVRALHDDDGGTAQPGQLETAWRSGRAEIKPVVGPAPVTS